VKVKIKCSLKGKRIWAEGLVLESPLPSDILNEIKRNTGTVEVIEKDVVLTKEVVIEPLVEPVLEPIIEVPIPDEIKTENKIENKKILYNKVTKTDILKMKKSDLIELIGGNKDFSDKTRNQLIKIAVGKL